MSFSERIDQLMLDRQVTPYKVSKETGIGQSTFTRWKKQSILPDGANLAKLADYFNVSADFLMGRTDDPTPPDTDIDPDEVEFALYQEIRDLTDEQKEEILKYARMVKEYHKKK